LRLLGRSDELLLGHVLAQDPYYNLFMIGDLEQMGTNHPHLFYWGYFAGRDLVGVAMRYRWYWNFYDAGGADLSRFARLVDAYPDSAMVNGRLSLVDAVVALVREYDVIESRQSHYCVLPLSTSLPAALHPVRRATQRDVEALARFYAHADTMRRDEASVRQCLELNRIFVAEIGGEIVSAALSNVETREMAMIGGVFTAESMRNRGYATAAMTALCASLIADGLEPCLFYDNPAAGTVYKRLGFQEIGEWRMASLQRK
jgi:predicted GNAT family acetyltransferase